MVVGDDERMIWKQNRDYTMLYIIIIRDSESSCDILAASLATSILYLHRRPVPPLLRLYGLD